jgi:hypothetical protein
MKIPSLLLAALVLPGLTLVAQERTVSRDEFEALERRMAGLERLVQTQKEVISEQATRLANAETGKPSAAPAASWADHVTVSGVIEVEAGYAHTSADGGESDLALATVELRIEARLNDWIGGSLVLLYEEDDTEEVTVDVGVITLGNPDAFPLYLEVGKMYVPFGDFASSFISDPLALELGETRETAARLRAMLGPLDLSLSVFNGDIEDDGSSHLDDFVLALAFAHEFSESVSLTLGTSYTSNLADSDGLTDRLDEMTGDTVLADKVAGVNLFAALAIGRVGLLAEYVGALDEFAADEILARREAKPSAWNFETSLAVTDALTVALRYETGNEFGDWLPETRYGIAASYLLHDGDWGATVLSLEYMRGEYDDEDGTDEDLLTAQLAIES